MCLALFAVRAHPRYGLILALNRDEFHDRPTAPAAFWRDSDILAGRDLRRGGTWLGITRSGRIGLVTTFREKASVHGARQGRSHGALVGAFLRGTRSPEDFLARVRERDDEFRGYNLLVGDAERLLYHSNRAQGTPRVLESGIYGLSNALLDAPWRKVARGRRALAARLDREGDRLVEGLFEVLSDRTLCTERRLPDTGIGPEAERMLSAAFVVSGSYGTRTSTVLLVENGGARTFVERSFGPDGSPTGEVAFRL